MCCRPLHTAATWSGTSPRPSPPPGVPDTASPYVPSGRPRTASWRWAKSCAARASCDCPERPAGLSWCCPDLETWGNEWAVNTNNWQTRQVLHSCGLMLTNKWEDSHKQKKWKQHTQMWNVNLMMYKCFFLVLQTKKKKTNFCKSCFSCMVYELLACTLMVKTKLMLFLWASYSLKNPKT